MYPCLLLITSLWLSLLCPSVWANDHLAAAVSAYRQGHYQRAQDALQLHHQHSPPTAKSLYYQAITSAQLGQLDQAGALYQQIVSTYPGSPEAQLAETGLLHLQSLAQPELDAPPGATPKQSPFTPAAISAEQLQLQGIMGLLGTPNNNATNTTDMSLMNLLMGIPQQPNGLLPGVGANPVNPLDPNVMSSMLMNQ
jgi:tetratricopeptide (TPR) repeat protein